MKNNIRKVCKRALGFALAFSLTASNGVVALAEGSELVAKDGYTISYHNSHNWTEYGEDIDGCDNKYKDTIPRECVQVTVPDVMAEYIWVDQYTRPWIRECLFSINDINNDEKWEIAYEHYKSYKMPIEGVGVALKCTDDSVWIIYQEKAYVSFYGADICSGVMTKDDHGNWNMRQPDATGTSNINCRIFFIQSTVNNCTDPRNGKYIRETGYYYYTLDLQDGGNSYDWGGSDHTANFVSNNFAHASSHDKWQGPDGTYRWFAGRTTLERLEKGQNATTGSKQYYESPTYGCVRDVQWFNGCTNSIGGGPEINFNADGTVRFVDNAVGGYLLADGHKEYFDRWKCGGHYSPIGYKVVYNGNGNTGGSTADTSCTYDETSYVSANGFTKTGYTFDHWSLDPNETWSQSTSNTKHPNDPIVNWTKTKDGTVTLYAIWKPITYYVQYNRGSTNN